MLLNTQGKNIDKETLKNAIISTAKHRETMDSIGIEYKDLIESLNKVGYILNAK